MLLYSFVIMLELLTILSSKKYIVTLTFLLLFALLSIDSTLYYSIGQSIFFTRTAYENSFLLSLESRVFLIVFSTVGPILGCIACGNTYAEDKESGMIPYIFIRYKHIRYHVNNVISIFICTFTLIFVPLCVNFLIARIAYPTHATLDNMYANPAYIVTTTADSFYELLRIYNPMLFIFITILTISLIFSVFASFNYSLTVFSGLNKYICNALTFITYISINTIFTKFGMIEHSFFNYIDPYLTNAGLFNLLMPLSLLTILSLILLFIGIRRSKYES